MRNRLFDSHGRCSVDEDSILSAEFKVLVKGRFFIKELSDYQKQLYRLVIDLNSKNWSPVEIASHLSDRGFLSTRGKKLNHKHIWSILNYHLKRSLEVSNKPKVKSVYLMFKSDKS